MNDTPHSVTLELNIAGFSSSDLDVVVPDFMTDRKTNLALTWRASAEGPESFRLIVEIAAGYSAGSFLKPFLQELSKDLYRWSKKKLSALFADKHHPTGIVSIEFDDVTVLYYSDGDEDMAAFFEELPKLFASVDLERSKRWRARFDQSQQTWQLETE